jgi:hypothetical protein
MPVPRWAAKNPSKPPASLCLNFTKELYKWRIGQAVNITPASDILSFRPICVHHRSRYIFGCYLPRSPTSFYLISPDGIRKFQLDAVQLFNII